MASRVVIVSTTKQPAVSRPTVQLLSEVSPRRLLSHLYYACSIDLIPKAVTSTCMRSQASLYLYGGRERKQLLTSRPMAKPVAVATIYAVVPYTSISLTISSQHFIPFLYALDWLVDAPVIRTLSVLRRGQLYLHSGRRPAASISSCKCLGRPATPTAI